MRHDSRGIIHLTGPDPDDPVTINPNYLDDPQDLKNLCVGLDLAREIGNSSELRPFTGREVAPGPMNLVELEQFFRDGLGAHWHQSGTAKMGRDVMSVVDSKLRVYGVDGLRVADASILPRVTTGNTMAPCVVIGEQAAAFLRKEGTLSDERHHDVIGSSDLGRQNVATTAARRHKRIMVHLWSSNAVQHAKTDSGRHPRREFSINCDEIVDCHGIFQEVLGIAGGCVHRAVGENFLGPSA